MPAELQISRGSSGFEQQELAAEQRQRRAECPSPWRPGVGPDAAGASGAGCQGAGGGQSYGENMFTACTLHN